MTDADEIFSRDRAEFSAICTVEAVVATPAAGVLFCHVVVVMVTGLFATLL